MTAWPNIQIAHSGIPWGNRRRAQHHHFLVAFFRRRLPAHIASPPAVADNQPRNVPVFHIEFTEHTAPGSNVMDFDHHSVISNAQCAGDWYSDRGAPVIAARKHLAIEMQFE